MRYPTLRQPLLCKTLAYVISFGAFLLPIVITSLLPFLPDIVKACVCFGFVIALIIHIFRGFRITWTMGVYLDQLSCYSTARTQYTLPSNFTVTETERKISRFGEACTPMALLPQPTNLRYKFNSPVLEYCRGVERVIVTYHTDLLDDDTYRAMIRSATANSKALIDHKKALFLSKDQKQTRLHRVTVILIYARQIDPRMIGSLYDMVCEQIGDELKAAVLPCIIDLSRNICTFDALRVTVSGSAGKDRGIRMIRRFIFGGTLPLRDNYHYLPWKYPISLDQSLWEFWREIRLKSGATQREIRKKLEGMRDKELSVEEDLLYVKWGEHGLMLITERDEERKTIEVENFQSWTYPKTQPVGKKTIQAIRQKITQYYKERGWTVLYVDPFEKNK